MADTTYYVNPGGASGDWGAGNNGNDGLSKANPQVSMSYTIDNHASDTPGTAPNGRDGDTITINIIDGAVFSDTEYNFNDVNSKHEGYNFIFQVDPTVSDPSGWNSVNVNLKDIMRFTLVTYGSLTVKNLNMTTPTGVNLFDFASGKGYDCILEDSIYAASGTSSRLYLRLGSAETGVDLTVKNSTVHTRADNISNNGGTILIDNSDITSLLGAYNIGVTASGIEKISITGGSSLSAPAGDGIFATPRDGGTPGKIVGTLILDDVTITAKEFGVYIEEGTKDCIIRNCTITSEEDSGVVVGRALFGEGLSFQRVLIDNNTITATATDARGLLVWHDTNNLLISNNRITGQSHAVFINGNDGVVENNIINATGSIGLGFFGNNLVAKNNTVHTVSNTGFITGSGGNTGTEKDQPASKNLSVYNNIFVSGSGLAFNDYDDSTGIAGGNGRGSSATLAETTTATDIDTNGVFTGTGSAWNTTGANQVFVGDKVIITAGTAVTLGEYEVAKVVSDTSLVVLGSPGDYVPASADLVYTIFHDDKMNDYMDYNCYWRESGSGIVTIGEVGSTANVSTIAALTAAWSEATSGFIAGDIETFWNVNFGTINDLNSLMVDPGLNSDFVATNPAVLAGGKPDADGNDTSMGATVSLANNNEQYEGNINTQYGKNNKQYGPE